MNKWVELKRRRLTKESENCGAPSPDKAAWKAAHADHHKRGGVNASSGRKRHASHAGGGGSAHFFGGRGQSAGGRRRDNVVERALRTMAIERQAGRCFYCERLMVDDLLRPGLQATLEHLTEWSEGGANSTENTVAACHDCNQGRPRTAEIRRAFAHYGGGELTKRMTDTAVMLAEERWREAIVERAAEAAAEVAEEDSEACEDGAADRIAFLQDRGEIIDCDDSMGGVLRLKTSLAHLRDRRLLSPGEHVALETYARLYSQAHDILQPFLPPHEMMEWRMERMFELSAIRRYALRDGRKMTAACDAVCGRGEWIIGRGRTDWERAKYLKLAAIRIARWLSAAAKEKKAA